MSKELNQSCWRNGNLSSAMSLLSGLLGLCLSLYRGFEKQSNSFQPVVVGGGGSDVISWLPLLIGLTSAASLLVGLAGMRKRFRLTLPSYLLLTGLVLVGFFMLGLMVTEQRSTMQRRLHTYMAIHFQSAAVGGDRFGVQETWDQLQIRMSCCGVDSYRDYLYRNEKGVLSKQDIPFSCCALKKNSPLPEADNPVQCQHDATLLVAESRFLHVQGCHGALSRWYMHHLSTVSGVLFLIICLQGIGVFYLSWVGYSKSSEERVMKL